MAFPRLGRGSGVRQDRRKLVGPGKATETGGKPKPRLPNHHRKRDRGLADLGGVDLRYTVLQEPSTDQLPR